VVLVASSLPGIAALAALLFTWVSVEQSGEQLRIAERGQVLAGSMQQSAASPHRL
jgi:hypothetical protein